MNDLVGTIMSDMPPPEIISPWGKNAWVTRKTFDVVRDVHRRMIFKAKIEGGFDIESLVIEPAHALPFYLVTLVSQTTLGKKIVDRVDYIDGLASAGAFDSEMRTPKISVRGSELVVRAIRRGFNRIKPKIVVRRGRLPRVRAIFECNDPAPRIAVAVFGMQRR
jgi:hypothetical protein